MSAVTAVPPRQAVDQHAAPEEGVELILHELRQIGTGGGFGLGEGGRGVLLHQAVQRVHTGRSRMTAMIQIFPAPQFG